MCVCLAFFVEYIHTCAIGDVWFTTAIYVRVENSRKTNTNMWNVKILIPINEMHSNIMFSKTSSNFAYIDKCSGQSMGTTIRYILYTRWTLVNILGIYERNSAASNGKERTRRRVPNAKESTNEQPNNDSFYAVKERNSQYSTLNIQIYFIYFLCDLLKIFIEIILLKLRRFCFIWLARICILYIAVHFLSNTLTFYRKRKKMLCDSKV